MYPAKTDKTTNPQDQVPTIPPNQVWLLILMNSLILFQVQFLKIPSATKKNWAWAATNVQVWNSVLTLTLVVPVAAFAEAFNHQPVLQSDGSWLWQYAISVQEGNFTAKLYGKIVTEGIEWTMLLSKVWRIYRL